MVAYNRGSFDLPSSGYLLLLLLPPARRGLAFLGSAASVFSTGNDGQQSGAGGRFSIEL